jgi:site-specific recombinase XerD
MISFNDAVEGYLINARARQLSPKTLDDYNNSFRHFRNWLNAKECDGDSVAIDEIDHHDIRDFLAWLSDVEIEPDSIAPKPARTLSKKSISNIHTALSALWTWAISEKLVDDHVVRAVQAPEPEQPAIKAFSKSDVERILEACRYTERYKREGKAECRNRRPTAVRDRAIVLTLLDTGARSGEIFQSKAYPERYARVGDLDQDNLTISVWGKGDKERLLRISPQTLQAIWRYLMQRDDYISKSPLFASARAGGPLTQSAVSQLMQRLGERAGVDNVHAHRFRHTFAINFLRNGGKTLELQHALGHTSLEMVKRYVEIAEVDMEDAHRRASPVANWHL